MIRCAALILAGVMFVTAGPKLLVEPSMINLGEVAAGTTQRVTIVLKNVGDGPLRIDQIKPSCGCTTIGTPASVIPAGRSDTVAMLFNTTGMSGKVQKQIQIVSNDPDLPTRSLAITAFVTLDFEVVRYGSSVYLGTRAVGTGFSERIGLRNISRRTLVITKGAMSIGGMKAVLKRTKVAPSDTVWVRLSGTPMRPGYHTEELVISTDNPNMPESRIRIHYTAAAP